MADDFIPDGYTIAFYAKSEDREFQALEILQTLLGHLEPDECRRVLTYATERWGSTDG